MTDSLESVNAVNAKSKRIQVRLVNVKERDATSTLSVFGMHVVTRTGTTFGPKICFSETKPRAKSSWTVCAKNGHQAPPGFSQT